MCGEKRCVRPNKLLELVMAISVFAVLHSPLLGSGPIVVNGDFAVASPEKAELPAGWALPSDTPWQRTDIGGYLRNTSLRYSTGARASVGPVTQSISLEGNTAYILSCAIKPFSSNQGLFETYLKPVVRLKYPGSDGAELVRIIGDGPAGKWSPYQYKFRSAAAGEVTVELWADVNHLQRGPGFGSHSGTIALDHVQVTRADQLDALPAGISRTFVHDNLALGKRYTLNPPPGYLHCNDPGDLEYLTDGQYTFGYFWTQKTTVGWMRVPNATVTIDLEDHYPIRGIAFNAAAGTAGVQMPSGIKIMVSVDGREYHDAGDLVALSAKRNPAPRDGAGHGVHRFYTDELRVHGRYVRLEITITPNTCFVDEIEVYRGRQEWKQLALPGDALIIPREHFGYDMANTSIKRRTDTDLEWVRAELEKHQNLPAGLRDRLDREIQRLYQAVLDLPAIADVENFRATFPLNPVHADVYAVMGALRKARGYPPLLAWRANPWDYLTPAQLPDDDSPAEIFVAAMKGETRAAAVNLTNCTEHPMTAHLTFDGLPGDAYPDYVSVHEVAWTDTREGTAVAAALPYASLIEGGYPISLPSGMTRQVWFSFTPRGIAAGIHHGSLVVQAATDSVLRVPVTFRVFDMDFPERPRLRVGGWDYTDGHLYGVTPQNRGPLIAHLQDRFVDSPWATRGVMPYGAFDSAGGYVKEPDTANFDAWVDRWPDARQYHVFNAVGQEIGGTKIDDPLFARKVASWMNFWVDHAKSRGVPPDKLCLLLVDESGSLENDQLIFAWSRAMKAVQPEVVIWDDGTRPAERNSLELMEAVDSLCPHRPAILPGAGAHSTLDFYTQFRRAGGRLALYSCMGPTRLLDPYTYYRLQAWSCFQLGAESTKFWAFSCSSNINAWNEYLPTTQTPYGPFFLDRTSVTPGKQMEAIRESVADFEYLSMFRDAVDDLEKRDPGHVLLPKARALAADAAERVLTVPGTTELMWKVPKDRSVADAVLSELADMLETIK